MGFSLNIIQSDINMLKIYSVVISPLTHNIEEGSLSFICALFSRQHTTCDRTVYHIKDLFKVQ